MKIQAGKKYISRLPVIEVKFTPIVLFRYSTKICLPAFLKDKKYVDATGETLNHYQKPIFLMMKHLTMWSPQGSVIIDITSGTGTTAVRIIS